MKNKLTDPEYWKKHFGDKKPFKFGTIPFHEYYQKYLKKDSSKSCIEIGAYPGGRLGYFAKEYNYQPTALDFIEDIEFIKANMHYNGIDNCEVIKADFLKWNPEEKYDLVCSFGFVEHFDDYEFVINKHIDLLNSGGILIISVPYLEYLQLWIRKILYTPEHYRKIMDAHNREIMKLSELKKVIFAREDMEEEFAEYVSGMKIWFPAEKGVIRMRRKWLYNILKKLERIVTKLGISNRFISPEILVIARKV